MEIERLFELADEGVKRALTAGADQAEVAATFSAGSQVEFEKNDLQIAMTDDAMRYGVRVIRKHAVGFATSNDPDALSDTVADAIAIADTSVPDDHNELPNPRPVESVLQLHDPAVAALTVEEMTALGADLLDIVRDRDARVSIDSGSVGASESKRVVCSSTGVHAGESSTSLSGHVFGMAVEGDRVGSFCVEGTASRRREGFREKLFKRGELFVEKTTGVLEAGPGESYRGLVLFTPEAVSSALVGSLLDMTNASAIRKGKSPLVGRLGEVIASPVFELSDNGRTPGAVGSSSFDREGLPHLPQTIVEGGTFRDMLYNHYEARAAGITSGSTGHAVGGATTLPTVGPTTLTIAPGERSLADIIGSAGPTERIVEVTRFSGNTNPVTGEFSGVVKAGYLLRDGERRPISETLIAGTILDVLRNIVAVSRESEAIFGRHIMPWVLADGISVTAG